MSRPGPHRLRRALTRFVTLVAAVAALGLATSTLATADPSASTWSKLRGCESSGNYHAVNPSGKYRGAYQFDVPTWQSVGGSGLPDAASAKEQDYRALYLYRMRGWQPWECAGILGLQNDKDGASRNAPGYADSAYMGGGGPGPAPAPGAMPKWDGLVYAQGDCSPSLRTFQLRMNQIGSKYHFQGTGCYQQNTKVAVVALQKANGINPSGRLGPKTWRAAWQGKAIG